MVAGNAARKLQAVATKEKDYTFLPEPLKYTSVSLRDIVNNNNRLEASTFNLEAKAAINKVKTCSYGYVNLWSKNGLIDNAFTGPRFKRIYVEKQDGIPIYQPSAIAEVFPKPLKFISEKTKVNIDALKVKKGMLLMTVSGTIGKCSIVGNTLNDQVFSHDLLRVTGKGKFDTGYIYAFFNTKEGQQILQTNTYGAVIQHVEAEHLENIIIPNAPEEIKREIHEYVMESFDLRDQSNDLIYRAEKILYAELQLPPIEELKPDFFDSTIELRNYVVTLSNLNGRLDCSYHSPLVQKIDILLKKNSKELLPLNHKNLTSKIYTGNRFVRVFVEKENGVPYLSGKQLLELDPNGFDKKYLSINQHEERINQQLVIRENCLIVTCSGTIGKTVLVPKHWDGWVGTHDLIRIIPSNTDTIGYVYCFLNSDYGQITLKSLTYGSVVDHIEAFHIAKMKIPILKDQSKQKQINDLVLKANDLRYEAYLKEHSAISKMEAVINSKRQMKAVK